MLRYTVRMESKAAPKKFKVLNKKAAIEFLDPLHKKYEFLRELIFKDCPHVGSTGENISTHHELCQEIIDHVGDLNGKRVLVWFNPEFFFKIRDKFPKAKITLVTGSKKAYLAGYHKRFGPNVEDVTIVNPFDIDDVKDEVKNMKFDFVVGNPPYQAQKDGDYSLWARFVDIGISLLNPDGFLGMITPTGWMSPTADIRKGRVSVLRDVFVKNNLLYVNIRSDIKDEYFKGIGSSFSWYIVQKNGNYTTTEFDTDEGNYHLDVSGIQFFPLSASKIEISIISKVTGKPGKKFDFVRRPHSFEGLSKDGGRYEFVNGNSNRLGEPYYSDTFCKTIPLRKVIIPYNGTRYTFVVDDGRKGITNCYWIELSSSETINGAQSFFGSKLIDFVTNQKRTQYNEGAYINSVPRIDLSRTWTDKELYDHFGLTDEERRHIDPSYKG